HDEVGLLLVHDEVHAREIAAAESAMRVESGALDGRRDALTERCGTKVVAAANPILRREIVEAGELGADQNERERSRAPCFLEHGARHLDPANAALDERDRARLERAFERGAEGSVRLRLLDHGNADRGAAVRGLDDENRPKSTPHRAETPDS